MEKITEKALDIIKKKGLTTLPDNKQWELRFEIKSETSNSLYTIARHKTNHNWGCSCFGWIRYRKCKHLDAVSDLLESIENLKLQDDTNANTNNDNEKREESYENVEMKSIMQEHYEQHYYALVQMHNKGGIRTIDEAELLYSLSDTHRRNIINVIEAYKIKDFNKIRQIYQNKGYERARDIASNPVLKGAKKRSVARDRIRQEIAHNVFWLLQAEKCWNLYCKKTQILIKNAIESLPKDKILSVLTDKGRKWYTVESLLNNEFKEEYIVSIDESDMDSKNRYFDLYKS